MSKHTEPVVYLEVHPAHGITPRDILDHCETLQAVSRRSYHDPQRAVVDRVEYAPNGRPLRMRVIFAEDATARDVATLRVTLEPYSDHEPTVRRGIVGTISTKGANA